MMVEIFSLNSQFSSREARDASVSQWWSAHIIRFITNMEQIVSKLFRNADN